MKKFCVHAQRRVENIAFTELLRSILLLKSIPDIGSKCIGAKVNQKLVPINHVLKNGDG